MSVLADLKKCAEHPKFRKLLAIRLVSQTGDGMFQVGLATLFFFRPETMTTAGGVAAAFAVLLLPFTIVGPFAGPLLDRWRRRQVLLYGNGIRVVLAIILASIMAWKPDSVVIYVLALVTLGVNRFLLSVLSAGLPHTLPRRLLLMANSITPTLGGIASVFGSVLGLLLNRIAPEGAIRNSVALLFAGALFATASMLALRLGAEDLGPEAPPTTPLRQEIGRVLGEMAQGASYLWRRGTPGAALTVMAVHRFLYGANFIALLLISRNLLVDAADADAGLAKFALIAGVSFLGNGLAIIATPIAHQVITPHQWILVCLGISGASQLLLTFTYQEPLIYVAAVLMGLGVQGAKIAVDTIVQGDTADAYRGRAFALYDMMYNAAFVGAAALAAVALPDTGWSAAVFAVLTFAYVLLSIWYWRHTVKLGGKPREVGSN